MRKFRTIESGVFLRFLFQRPLRARLSAPQIVRALYKYLTVPQLLLHFIVT